MKSLLKFCLLTGTLVLGSCRQDPLGSTGVQLDIRTTDSRIYASYFEMTWLDEQSQLFQVRVPEQEGAFIDAEQAPAVSVFIALTSSKAGVRRVLVRGYRDGSIISEGAARMRAARNVWVQLGLEMKAAGTLIDQDGDGLPDTVDNCPHERDPCGGGAPPPDMDAGVDEVPDAGDDAAADAELPMERPPVNPTNIADGGAFDTAADARTSDARDVRAGLLVQP